MADLDDEDDVDDVDDEDDTAPMEGAAGQEGDAVSAVTADVAADGAAQQPRTSGSSLSREELPDGTHLLSSDEMSQSSSRYPAGVSEGIGGTSLLDRTSAGLVSAGVDHRVVSAGREVIYERRALPRISYVSAGELQWKDRRVAVTLLDLSESGLRCEISSNEPAAARPGNAEYVRIRFDIPSGQVDVKAQVAWSRRAEAGTQYGLQFLKPSAEAAARLTEVCRAGVPL